MADLFTPPPPSGLIEEIYENLNVTCKEFAERLGIDPEHLKLVIEGKRPINADLALRLEKAVENPSAEVWLRMQAQYELRKAKVAIDLSQIIPFPPTHRLTEEELERESEKTKKIHIQGRTPKDVRSNIRKK